MDTSYIGMLDIPANVKRMESHQDINLLKESLDLIPIEKIQDATLTKFRQLQKDMLRFKRYENETVLFESTFLSEFIKWFKNDFFKWFDQPNCKVCNVACVPLRRILGGTNISVDAVEIFRCPTCNRNAYFKRFNDSRILLETRTGRCHEHAQICALMCKALKYDTRMVFDVNDHIWVEVYSDLQKRWIHCDPSEGVIDKPLMYEKGWNKKMSYILAIGESGIHEVTWRYSSDHSGIRWRRIPSCDKIILECSREHLNKVLPTFSETKRKYILNRLIKELVELLTVIPSSEDNYEGRQSGSKDWRLMRGEVQSAIDYVGFTCKFTNMSNSEEREQRYAIWYCSNKDVYMITDFIGYDSVYTGWNTCVFEHKNITRKQEFDWKKTYLARERGDDFGLIRWRLDVSESGYTIIGFSLLTNFFICDTGDATCSVYNDKNYLTFDGSHTKIEKRLNPDESLMVEITLRGGTGTNAWQHAQFSRQSMKEGPNVSFGISLKLLKLAPRN